MTLSLPLGFAFLLLAALFLEPLSKRLHLPFPTLLVGAGFLVSEALVAAGVDTGLRWHHFHDLVLHLLLPILIFESALHLRPARIKEDLVPILVLALPGVAIGATLTGTLLFWGINHPTGFPWPAALLAGVLLAATDPVSVVALCRRLGAPERLTALLEGESLFNDATAVVLYTLLLPVAILGASPDGGWTWGSGMAQFLWSFLGGLGCGFVAAAIVRGVLHRLASAVPAALFTVAMVVLTYYLVEQAMGASGILALLVMGLATGEACRRVRDDFVMRFWGMNAWMGQVILFVLAGATITIAMFAERWLAMLIAVGAMLVARAFTLSLIHI